MLQLKNISLTQFKNYEASAFKFENKITGIFGKNGAGKTNLLDAIYYLCFTKSIFNRTDLLNVKQGFSGFRIEGNFELQNQLEKITCIFRENGKKEMYAKDVAYTKFSEHVGKYPCVMVGPDDIKLINGDSKERRFFLDTLLCQVNSDYLKALMLYTRILQQRNAYLKTLLYGTKINSSLLDVLDEQLILPANFIFEFRKKFLTQFFILIKQNYCQLCNNEEELNFEYESLLFTNSMQELLQKNREKDCLSLRTSAGIHKDEIHFYIENRNFKTSTSQGQRKSLLFAIKLAETKAIYHIKGYWPILLLDDVFEKLDNLRITNLFSQVCTELSSQVFITDTDSERLKKHLLILKTDYTKINI